MIFSSRKIEIFFLISSYHVFLTDNKEDELKQYYYSNKTIQPSSYG